MLKKGLNSFQLKIIALICMVIDHVHYMLAGQLGVPFWFGIIGRISAPIFIFITAQGMKHTRNQKKYMLRLYIASVLMILTNGLVNEYLPHPQGAMVINNIFATLFLITWFIYALEQFHTSFKEKQVSLCLRAVALLSMPILSSFITLELMNRGQMHLFKLFYYFVPSVMFVEGGFFLVILGVGFYFFSKNKWQTAIFYTLISLSYLFLVAQNGWDSINLFYLNYQWLMILALPFILLYNGLKGKNSKWFFYIFYPSHVYALLILSRFIG